MKYGMANTVSDGCWSGLQEWGVRRVYGGSSGLTFRCREVII